MEHTALPAARPAHDCLIDAQDLLCPLPVLKARKALAALPEGAVVLLLSTDPAAVIDLPHFCQEAGHSLLAQERCGALSRWWIARGPERAEPET